MIRIATPEDAARLEAFLQPYAVTSMFLRGNLAAHGIGASDHANATTYYLCEAAGQITAVAGCTNGGFLMCQAPGANADFWEDCARALQGRTLVGMTGVPEQVEAFAAALGFEDSAFRLKDVQPLYALSLSDLPDLQAADVSLRRPRPDETRWLASWFDAYHHETGMGTLGGTDGQLAARQFVERADARVMEIGGVVCAMSALNARTSDMVQVGGVYVPPEHRGCGHGGRIVALHLAEVRGQGIRAAILFAATSFAARAYEAIGFRRIGSYQISLLDTPRIVGRAA
ncbi:N-acetyltransferase [Roseobacter cerasinus]|uniref:N-acetyltransferase n=1 Tax=Roseobacter cerasinus TaxID=2602289 RepID=A0A640VRT1_9RHOB|nr:GNAT family N-acetyltransferase [Roseobacter cerasinus]GFE50729.1 N-acetyltransferase [Roseobacter cerasinus]